MKKLLFLFGGLLFSWAITAQNIENQAISYSDAALLFSGEDDNGTARYNAMGGAFGALGGDFSATAINPAGAAVFNNSSFGITFGLRNSTINTNFYDTSVLSEDDFFNITQAGGVLVFNAHRDSNWSKFVIGFNYNLARDYETNWLVEGNSGFAPLTDFYDPNIVYPNIQGQTFKNFMNGENGKFVLSFASQYNDKLYIGAAITTHNIDFIQFAQAEEFNGDDIDNTFDVLATQELLTTGSGVSFSAGIIAKPTQEIRLGIAIQSPTWYNLTETLRENDHQIFINNEFDSEVLLPLSELEYNISTPARVTGSFAYVFGKEGLLSFDYTYKDYSNLKLRPSSDFNGENLDLENNLKGSSQFKVGVEFRLDNISLRGGYRYEESPFINGPSNSIKRTYGDLTGYSFGIGFKFGNNTKLDLAYQNTERQDLFKFQDVPNADPANIDLTNDKFTATLVIGL